MKNLNFYVCPTCGNILTSAMGAAVTCCGKKLSPLDAVKAPEEARLSVELIENDYFITSSHPMTKEHYISFVALVTGDTLILKRNGICRPGCPVLDTESLFGTVYSMGSFTSWCDLFSSAPSCGILSKSTG